MRLLLFTCCLFAFASLSAQDGAASPATANEPAGVLAYATPTTVAPAPVSFTSRRERTLLGDLDLSGAWAGPTYKYAFTGDDSSLQRGGFGGLEFSDEIFLGYGGWKSRETFTVDNPVENSPRYDFNHSGFIFAYAPFADNAIHPRITTIFGPGKLIFDPEDNAGIPDVDKFEDRMFVGQATAGLELNLFQWFRLGVEGGYRFASGLDANAAGITEKDVSGATFQIEARFGFSW